ncbi:hypothetical protein KJ815_06450, partial [bacterium]|nr:hypothetical protein [bacterium]
MVRRFSFLAAGLLVLFVYSGGLAQPPNQDNRVDRWNDMWMNQNNMGFFGNNGPLSSFPASDPCPPYLWAPQCELPGGSDQQYLFWAGLWIGAIVLDSGLEVPRVSVGTDGWLNPDLNEFWPPSGEAGGIRERSRRDTVNCFGDPIYDPEAVADHEFIAVFTDTLDDEPYVVRDFDGTRHRPLGLRVTRTTHTMMEPPCNHIYWIHYLVENIGNNFLKNVYFGHYVDGDVGPSTEVEHHTDDITGYEAVHQIAYICDNDGRAHADGSGNDFNAPHITGTIFLRLPEGIERVSFNWWVSHVSAALDYGPSWEAYADRDSLGMGWTRLYGTPMGDLRKYQIMSNGEHDFDQVYAADPQWIAAHPQDGHAWSLSDPSPNAPNIANGYDTRYLLSFGPLGTPVGSHRELRPGESFDLWMAYVGGLNFHDPDHPQPTNDTINPNLFNFTDLIAHVEAARAGDCFNWLSAEPRPTINVPARFALDPLWPNPFNARANIRFHLNHAGEVTIRAYDILGRSALEITRETFGIGTHTIAWNAAGMPS